MCYILLKRTICLLTHTSPITIMFLIDLRSKKSTTIQKVLAAVALCINFGVAFIYPDFGWNYYNIICSESILILAVLIRAWDSPQEDGYGVFTDFLHELWVGVAVVSHITCWILVITSLILGSMLDNV